MPKITDVKGMTVTANFPWHYVRIYTNDSAGLYGTGECFLTLGFLGILESLKPILIGKDIKQIQYIIESLKSASSGAGSNAGIVLNVITGVEAALFDALGKFQNISISQLFGGKVRDSVRVYADCHGGEGLEALSEVLQPVEVAWSKPSQSKETRKTVIEGSVMRAKKMAELGYDFLKFDFDLPDSSFDSAVGYPLTNKDIEWMLSLVKGIRDAVGFGVDLAFDAHWRYRAKEMLIVAKELEPYRIAWLEDPLPMSDLEGLTYIRERTTTPIATGENHQLLTGFYQLIASKGCDIVTPDLQKSGGLLDAKNVAGLAQKFNMPFAPHMIGSPLAIMTTAQFSATVPNFLAMEFHGFDVPFYSDIVGEDFKTWFHHGKIDIPEDRYGIGLELDIKEIKKYVKDNSTFFSE